MALDKTADHAREQHHHTNGDDHGRDHDYDLIDHTDGGNHRVEREDNVESKNLQQNAAERRPLADKVMFTALFELKMHLSCALRDQKQTASDQNECAAGEIESEDRHQGLG